MPKLKISINEIDNGFMVESNYGGAFDREQGKTALYAKTLHEAVELLKDIADEYARLEEEAKIAPKVRPVTIREKMKAILETMTALAGGDQAGIVSEEAVKTALHGKYQSKEVQSLIGELLKDGVIYSPKPGYIRRTAP